MKTAQSIEIEPLVYERVMEYCAYYEKTPSEMIDCFIDELHQFELEQTGKVIIEEQRKKETPCTGNLKCKLHFAIASDQIMRY